MARIYWKLARISPTVWIILNVFTTLMTYLIFANAPSTDLDPLTLKRRLTRLTSKMPPTFLLTMVMSSPNNTDVRQTIRKTWVLDALDTGPDDTKTLFVVGIGGLTYEEGIELVRENQKHNDMLLLTNVKDHYSNLTLKILHSFRWASEHVNHKFLLKVDDDSFVRVKNLLKDLHGRKPRRFYMGFFDGRAPVRQSGKWTESDWVLCDRYIPYALGGGYVLSVDLVDYIALNFGLLKRFRNEDVSVGTWLAPLEIRRFHDVRFDTEFRSRGCHNEYLVTHRQTMDMMRQKHSHLKKFGLLCETEKRARVSYRYNWDVPPSECCQRVDRSVP